MSYHRVEEAHYTGLSGFWQALLAAFGTTASKSLSRESGSKTILRFWLTTRMQRASPPYRGFALLDDQAPTDRHHGQPADYGSTVGAFAPGGVA